MNKRAVILAGGKASRLGSYSTVLPKPLLPIDDRPVLDIVLHQLREAEFQRITLAVGYLSHLVRAVIANGSNHGVTIDYHDEQEPLGTVGALREIDGLDDSFLLMNGDVLTTLDYGKLLDAHRGAGNAMTIATHRRTIHSEYGVLHVANGNGNGNANGNGKPTQAVTGFEEKPELTYAVSMGVYALEPSVLEHIPEGKFDLPDLVLALVAAGEQVGGYGFDGSWFDLSRHDDYQQALDEIELQSFVPATAEPVGPPSALDMLPR